MVRSCRPSVVVVVDRKRVGSSRARARAFERSRRRPVVGIVEGAHEDAREDEDAHARCIFRRDADWAVERIAGGEAARASDGGEEDEEDSGLGRFAQVEVVIGNESKASSSGREGEYYVDVFREERRAVGEERDVRVRWFRVRGRRRWTPRRLRCGTSARRAWTWR